MESRRQTYITLGGLVVLAVVLFTISGIDRFKNGHGLDGSSAASDGSAGC